MSQVSQCSSALVGNTNTTRARRWCLTLNNYSENEYDCLVSFANKRCCYFVIGKEVGDVSKVSHLQGYLEFKNQMRFSTMKRFNDRIHWEVAKGDRDSNYMYCTKSNDFICSISDDEDEIWEEFKDIEWRPWQKRVLELVDGPVDRRKIYFIVDQDGNTGKSFLCKYLDLKYDVIIADGKSDNIFNQVLNAKNRKVVICDVPRCNLGFINYGAIEKVKNGHIYSGKYEGGKCIFKIPHVFIFMNEYPDMDALSKDRYAIICACDKEFVMV